MPSILVVQDDPTAKVLQHDLQNAGYQTFHASSVMQGITPAREHNPALLLLDLTLPDGDGRDLLVRLTGTDVRIIILTDYDDIHVKVELLNLGANDYVVKPYNVAELLARVAVQLRLPLSDVLKIQGLELSPSKRFVTHNGIELRLAPTEFEILALLMTNPGKVHARETIYEAVWGKERPPGSNLVDMHLAYLRGKFRAAGIYGVLRTVRGAGYAIRV